MITVNLSPNTDRDDVTRSIRMLFTPWHWKQGVYEESVVSWLSGYTHAEPFFFSSARSALTTLLSAMGIGPGDEVIIQAFTCIVVVNAISFTGATPVFADIDKTMNIDPDEIRKHISEKTKAIIVQHTFGTPADMDRIMSMAGKHGIPVIEDCAHALGGTYKKRPLGTIGTAAIWSFGRDKVVSSVFGGAVSVHDARLSRAIRRVMAETPYPDAAWIGQQLFHPIAFHLFILPLYRIGIGKAVLVSLQKLGLLSFPVSMKERQGMQPSVYRRRFPNALAYLLLGQVQKLPRFTEKRNRIADYYDGVFTDMTGIQIIPRDSQGAALRYGILVQDPVMVRREAKKHGIILGNWYHDVVDPGGDTTQKRYRIGSCPHAEHAARHIVNLPTTITKADASDIVSCIRSIL